MSDLLSRSSRLTPFLVVCVMLQALVGIAVAGGEGGNGSGFLSSTFSGNDSSPHCMAEKLMREAYATRGAQSVIAETTRAASIPAIRHRASRGTATDASSAPLGYAPLRIMAVTADLDSPQYYCAAAGDTRSNYLGGTLTCGASDVLTAEKRRILVDKVIPAAIQMHQERLYVPPLSSITVSGLANYNYCRSLHHPSPLPYTMTDADFILYVSAAPTAANNLAWASACAWQADGRPVVGIANVGPSSISDSDYTVRVVAHEILHALGFLANTFAARGMAVAVPSLRGKTNVPALGSPKILEVARAHYGCSSLGFVELEDTGGATTTASHFKMRNARDELMIGYTGLMLYTAFTIAAMEDTGFYKGNYANAEEMAWGKDAGCELFSEQCVNPATGKSILPTLFCDALDTEPTCTADRLGLGYCGLVAYRVPLPTYAQYFAGRPNVGGSTAAMDYCPYRVATSAGSCADGDAAGVAAGSVLSSTARCLSAASDAGVRVNGASRAVQGVCADVTCYGRSRTYYIRLKGMKEFVKCPAGQDLAPATLAAGGGGVFGAGALRCPAYAEVCSRNTVLDAYDPDEIAEEPDGDGASASEGTDGSTSWTALSDDPRNYHPFTCQRNGTTWTQYNRCTSTTNGNRTCLGDYVQDSLGQTYSAASGYQPCQLSSCAGWYCDSGNSGTAKAYILAQRYSPSEVEAPLVYNTLSTRRGDACHCVPVANDADSAPDTTTTAEALSKEAVTALRVVQGGAGYREDDPACLAADFSCANASYHLERRAGKCFCCPHRDQPAFSQVFVTCSRATRRVRPSAAA